VFTHERPQVKIKVEVKVKKQFYSALSGLVFASGLPSLDGRGLRGG